MSISRARSSGRGAQTCRRDGRKNYAPSCLRKCRTRLLRKPHGLHDSVRRCRQTPNLPNIKRKLFERAYGNLQRVIATRRFAFQRYLRQELAARLAYRLGGSAAGDGVELNGGRTSASYQTVYWRQRRKPLSNSKKSGGCLAALAFFYSGDGA